MCHEWIAGGDLKATFPKRGVAILDSGASTTVTGTNWMQACCSSYKDNLMASSRSFRFGPGSPVKSSGKTTIYADLPVVLKNGSIGQIQCAIEVEIGPRDTPF